MLGPKNKSTTWGLGGTKMAYIPFNAPLLYLGTTKNNFGVEMHLFLWEEYKLPATSVDLVAMSEFQK